MAVLKSILMGVVLAGTLVTVAVCGVVMGIGLVAGATISRRTAAAVGTVLVGFAAAVALGALRLRGFRHDSLSA